MERDRLLSNGGSMTMFPQEPHTHVGGCTTNLTQTTQVPTRQTLPVARVLGDYYRKPLPIGRRSLSGCPTLAGATSRYVRGESPRLYHARTHEAKCSRLCKPFLSVLMGGAGQRALTVPTSTTQRFTHIVVHMFQKCKRLSSPLAPNKERHSHPNP